MTFHEYRRYRQGDNLKRSVYVCDGAQHRERASIGCSTDKQSVVQFNILSLSSYLLSVSPPPPLMAYDADTSSWHSSDDDDDPAAYWLAPSGAAGSSSSSLRRGAAAPPLPLLKQTSSQRHSPPRMLVLVGLTGGFFNSSFFYSIFGVPSTCLNMYLFITCLNNMETLRSTPFSSLN